MLQSELFTKTRKEAPSDEVSKNAELLIRAGFVYKEMAGVYAYLPLGLRVLNKIVQVIREEMNAIGGQEVFLTALQEKSTWEKTNRWDDAVVDNWFKTKLKNNTELGLSFTHEEPLTKLLTNYVSSYRDLPKLIYQFQTKFRNEVRAKSGIMRGREFLMKDLYSFAKTEEEHKALYAKVQEAYVRIFERLGLGDRTFITFASGGTFSKYSHEFQTLTDAGEDDVYVDAKKKIAINKEVFTDEVCADLGVSKNELTLAKAVEVGNIFSLGTKFSEPFELLYNDEEGNKKPVIMGSYGIGPSRTMGVIAEILSDEKGLVWPENIAPFLAHIISVGKDREAKVLYEELTKAGVEVLLDDRDASFGAKMNDADLLGIPYRIVVSEKAEKSGGYEVKKRADKEVHILAKEQLLTILALKKRV